MKSAESQIQKYIVLKLHDDGFINHQEFQQLTDKIMC